MIHRESYDEVLDGIIAVGFAVPSRCVSFCAGRARLHSAIHFQTGEGTVRHISGQELLGGMRSHALEEYGPMAMMVLGEWGIRRCEDFGEIVFNMVEHELLAKTDEDSRDDFSGGYDFEDAFRKPFLPPETAAPSTDSAQRNITPVADSDNDRSGQPSEPESSDKQ